MEEKNELLSLSTPIKELEEKILSEDDVTELENIVNLFNLNIKRKDIIRANKLSELQDKISEQMAERIDKKAYEFSNKDLLDYFKVIQETINKNDNSLKDTEMPTIQINQVNMNENSLDRESRQRVMDAVKSILNNVEQQSSQPSEEDIIDIEPEDIEIVEEI